MHGKSVLAHRMTRWAIDQGLRVHVVRLGDTRGHIVQKIKGEVCWRRIPKPEPAPSLVLTDELYIYDESHKVFP